MAQLPLDDISRGSKLDPIDDWQGKLGRSFADATANFSELYGIVATLISRFSWSIAPTPPAVAFTGAPPLLGMTLAPAAAAASFASTAVKFGAGILPSPVAASLTGNNATRSP